MKCAIKVDWDTVGDYEREHFVNFLQDKLNSMKVPNCA